MSLNSITPLFWKRLFQAGVLLAILGGVVLAPALLFQVIRYFAADPGLAVLSLAGILGWSCSVVVLLKLTLSRTAKSNH